MKKLKDVRNDLVKYLLFKCISNNVLTLFSVLYILFILIDSFLRKNEYVKSRIKVDMNNIFDLVLKFNII